MKSREHSRMLAIRVAAVLYGALMGWSCASQSGSSTLVGISSDGEDGGEVIGTSASSGGFGGSTGMAANSSGPGMVATLCGDPACPPLPGEDGATDDGAGRPAVEGGTEASADGNMADGAGQEQDAPTDGSRSDSGGDGGSPNSQAAGD